MCIYIYTWEGGERKPLASWCKSFASFGDACDQKTRPKHDFVALLVKSYSAIEAVAQLLSSAKGWKTAIRPRLLTT